MGKHSQKKKNQRIRDTKRSSEYIIPLESASSPAPAPSIPSAAETIADLTASDSNIPDTSVVNDLVADSPALNTTTPATLSTNEPLTGAIPPNANTSEGPNSIAVKQADLTTENDNKDDDTNASEGLDSNAAKQSNLTTENDNKDTIAQPPAISEPAATVNPTESDTNASGGSGSGNAKSSLTTENDNKSIEVELATSILPNADMTKNVKYVEPVVVVTNARNVGASETPAETPVVTEPTVSAPAHTVIEEDSKNAAGGPSTSKYNISHSTSMPSGRNTINSDDLRDPMSDANVALHTNATPPSTVAVQAQLGSTKRIRGGRGWFVGSFTSPVGLNFIYFGIYVSEGMIIAFSLMFIKRAIPTATSNIGIIFCILGSIFLALTVIIHCRERSLSPLSNTKVSPLLTSTNTNQGVALQRPFDLSQNDIMEELKELLRTKKISAHEKTSTEPEDIYLEQEGFLVSRTKFKFSAKNKEVTTTADIRTEQINIQKNYIDRIKGQEQRTLSSVNSSQVPNSLEQTTPLVKYIQTKSVSPDRVKKIVEQLDEQAEGRLKDYQAKLNDLEQIASYKREGEILIHYIEEDLSITDKKALVELGISMPKLHGRAEITDETKKILTRHLEERCTKEKEGNRASIEQLIEQTEVALSEAIENTKLMTGMRLANGKLIKGTTHSFLDLLMNTAENIAEEDLANTISDWQENLRAINNKKFLGAVFKEHKRVFQKIREQISPDLKPILNAIEEAQREKFKESARTWVGQNQAAANVFKKERDKQTLNITNYLHGIDEAYKEASKRVQKCRNSSTSIRDLIKELKGVIEDYNKALHHLSRKDKESPGKAPALAKIKLSEGLKKLQEISLECLRYQCIELIGNLLSPDEVKRHLRTIARQFLGCDTASITADEAKKIELREILARKINKTSSHSASGSTKPILPFNPLKADAYLTSKGFNEFLLEYLEHYLYILEENKYHLPLNPEESPPTPKQAKLNHLLSKMIEELKALVPDIDYSLWRQELNKLSEPLKESRAGSDPESSSAKVRGVIKGIDYFLEGYQKLSIDAKLKKVSELAKECKLIAEELAKMHTLTNNLCADTDLVNSELQKIRGQMTGFEKLEVSLSPMIERAAELEKECTLISAASQDMCDNIAKFQKEIAKATKEIEGQMTELEDSSISVHLSSKRARELEEKCKHITKLVENINNKLEPMHKEITELDGKKNEVTEELNKMKGEFEKGEFWNEKEEVPTPQSMDKNATASLASVKQTRGH